MPASFAIDNSVVMAWCLADEANSYADDVLESLESRTAVAPAIWPLEVGNVLLVAERKKRLTQSGVTRFLALVNGLPITVDQETPERMLTEIFSLAHEWKLSTYDASYLDLAVKLNLPLTTPDAALSKAAEACNVPIYSPAGIR